jgi:hypothetical protein
MISRRGLIFGGWIAEVRPEAPPVAPPERPPASTSRWADKLPPANVPAEIAANAQRFRAELASRTAGEVVWQGPEADDGAP